MESRMEKIQRLGQEADAALKAQAAEAERAAVVAWLRAQAKAWETFPEEDAYQIAAAAIEARAHLPPHD